MDINPELPIAGRNSYDIWREIWKIFGRISNFFVSLFHPPPEQRLCKQSALSST